MRHQSDRILAQPVAKGSTPCPSRVIRPDDIPTRFQEERTARRAAAVERAIGAETVDGFVELGQVVCVDRTAQHEIAPQVEEIGFEFADHKSPPMVQSIG